MSTRLTSIVGRRARALLAGIVLSGAAGSALAEDFTAGAVLKNMGDQELTAYLAGMVEAFAYGRYVRDANADGAKCVYDWFYEKEATQLDIMTKFASFPDHAPGAVMLAMLQKECGS